MLIGVTTIPPVPKVVSKDPSILYRASANKLFPDGSIVNPPATIFSSLCISILFINAKSFIDVVILPFIPKVVSIDPSILCFHLFVFFLYPYIFNFRK